MHYAGRYFVFTGSLSVALFAGCTSSDSPADMGASAGGSSTSAGGSSAGSSAGGHSTGGSSAGGSGAGGSSAGGSSAGGAGGASTGPYLFALTGTGFNIHEGKTVTGTLTDDTGAALRTGSTVIRGDHWEFAWPSIMTKGSTYHFYFYVDVNGNGACDKPSTDHVWQLDFEKIADKVDQEFAHNAMWVDVCSKIKAPAGLDVTFSGTGFTADAGKTISTALIEEGTPIAFGKGGVGDTGTSTFTFLGAATSGKKYALNYWVDTDDNDLCNPAKTQANPTGDKVWTVDLGIVTAKVKKDVTSDTNYTDVCKSFDY